MNPTEDYTQYFRTLRRIVKKGVMLLELEETLPPNVEVTGTNLPTIYLYCNVEMRPYIFSVLRAISINMKRCSATVQELDFVTFYTTIPTLR